MPEASQAATIFTLFIAPGFLMVRGYGHRRYRTTPERDIYAVAEAVVASAIWLACVWAVLLLCGDPVREWGMVPLKTKLLEEHRPETLALLLTVIIVPYGVGAGLAAIIDRLERESPWFLRFAQRFGLMRNLTAWDRAWLTFERMGPGEVQIRLKDGSMIRGAWGEGAQVDLSPSPDHHVMLVQGYHQDAGKSGQDVEVEGSEVVIRAQGPDGVFIQGDEISAVFFKATGGNDERRGAGPAPEPDGPA